MGTAASEKSDRPPSEVWNAYPTMAASIRIRAIELPAYQRLKSIVEDGLKSKTAQEWQDILNAAGVPAGRVLSVPEALEQPQIADRELIASFDEVPHAQGTVRVVRTGIKIDGQSPRVPSSPPELGQHTREILSEAGFSHSEMDDMARNGVI